jgi:2-polyprenyl-6-methoxyphenol hydroxylase-like FAD-dependent oxidoreductase
MTPAQEKRHDFDVIIVGGGLTGSSLATALADGRRRILVLEARVGKNPRFNGELIHPSGVDQLDALGFLDDLHAAGGVDVKGFAACASVAQGPTPLPYSEIPGSRPFGFAIDHHDLVDVLRRIAGKKPGVEYRFGERVTALVYAEERVIGVQTPSGPVHAPLVLAADGRHSKIRALVELPERARLLSYTAAARLPDCELPVPGHGHIFLGAPGPILAYPISATDARTCIDLPTDMDRGKQAVLRNIEERYFPVLPAVVRPSFERALASAKQNGDLEIAANYAIYTDECTVPGVALVGDACGCSHPLTATGMTVALNDVRELALKLDGVPLSDASKLDAALQSYQQARYRFVRAREILADAMYEVFLGAEDGTRAIREGIFRYWRGNEVHRARSMALLSGHDSRLESFVREYVKVVAMSTSTALLGRVNQPTLVGRVRSLLGLGRKTVEKVGIAARSVREGYLA